VTIKTIGIGMRTNKRKPAVEMNFPYIIYKDQVQNLGQNHIKFSFAEKKG
jgi:hypothetical protein